MKRALLLAPLVLSACFFGFDRGQEIGPGDVAGTATRDGAPAPGAFLKVAGTLRTGRTGADGSFLLRGLPAGTFALSLRADDDGDGWPERATDRALQLRERNGEVASLLLGEVELAPVVQVSGEVRRDGAPQPGARVFALGQGTLEELTVDLPLERSVTTDIDGRFEFPAIAARPTELVAFFDDGEVSLLSPRLRIDPAPGEILELAPLELEVPPENVALQVFFTPAPDEGERGSLELLAPGGAPSPEVDPGAPALGDSISLVIRPGLYDLHLRTSAGRRADLPGVLVAPRADDGPVILAFVEITSRPLCGADGLDCDEDGVTQLPRPPGFVDVITACAEQCLAAERPATCEADGAVFDCDDDGDGQPDLTEPLACAQPFGSTDLDGDRDCDLSDPFPQCAANDPADPSCRGGGVFSPLGLNPEWLDGPLPVDAGPDPDAGPPLVDAGPDAGPPDPFDAGPLPEPETWMLQATARSYVYGVSSSGELSYVAGEHSTDTGRWILGRRDQPCVVDDPNFAGFLVELDELGRCRVIATSPGAVWFDSVRVADRVYALGFTFSSATLGDDPVGQPVSVTSSGGVLAFVAVFDTSGVVQAVRTFPDDVDGLRLAPFGDGVAALLSARVLGAVFDPGGANETTAPQRGAVVVGLDANLAATFVLPFGGDSEPTGLASGPGPAPAAESLYVLGGLNAISPIFPGTADELAGAPNTGFLVRLDGAGAVVWSTTVQAQLSLDTGFVAVSPSGARLAAVGDFTNAVRLRDPGESRDDAGLPLLDDANSGDGFIALYDADTGAALGGAALHTDFGLFYGAAFRDEDEVVAAGFGFSGYLTTDDFLPAQVPSPEPQSLFIAAVNFADPASPALSWVQPVPCDTDCFTESGLGVTATGAIVMGAYAYNDVRISGFDSVALGPTDPAFVVHTGPLDLPPAPAVDAGPCPAPPAAAELFFEEVNPATGGFDPEFALQSRLNGQRSVVLDFEDPDLETFGKGALSFNDAQFLDTEGVRMSAPGGLFVDRDFGDPPRFTAISGNNMFAPGPVENAAAPAGSGGNQTTFTFETPTCGTAYTTGFGAHFIDVEGAGSRIELFDIDDALIGTVEVTASGFFGAVVTDLYGHPVSAVARVVVTNGAGWPGVTAHDGVALDNLIFGAPAP